MSERTILYIEDNFHNRRLVRKILKSRGYNVIEAEDGHTGWQMVQDLHPPLVLMDISIPGIDGLEVTRRIKEDAKLQHIPVIAITAAAMVGDKERFLAAGCDDYLSKPIQPLNLLKKIAYHYPK
jgi:CheY-like chemotaxis protein